MLVGGQVFDVREPSERTHGVRLQKLCVAQDGGDFFAPESEAAMLLECGHVGEDDALVFEEGPAPFDGFDDARTGLVYQFTDVIQDRLCEGFGLGDVGVDLAIEGAAGIEGAGWAHDSLLKVLLNSVTAFGARSEGVLQLGRASTGRLVRLKSIEMSDTLYLSLWFPNLRLAALPDKLTAVLGAFAAHGGDARVYSATVWPVGWSESPVLQHVYGRGERGAEPQQAVEAALELLHDDYAYEFQIGWDLWELETASNLDPRWAREPRLVRVTGFGPLFAERTYEQDGHIRIDFGDDAAFLEVDADLDAFAARHIEENVRQLVELTSALEKVSGATARVLWSELGESLAQRLAARLGMGN